MKMIRLTTEFEPSFGLLWLVLKAFILGTKVVLPFDLTDHNVRQMMIRVNSDEPPDEEEKIPFTK